ncbi:hypothetical protein DH2020_032504 [Rehmannia glutinosa]|uniref:Uncharacterized protein n=1 Tax=Rehmannia glutinosa TaxID=99300 RepID=A0ABR0VF42_REHGL
MYVTRPLSQLLKSPDILTAPPDGPNSGYLVIQDEESESYSCFGCCKKRTVKDLPVPQDKELIVRYTQSTPGQGIDTSEDPLLLIPVLNQPLSSNRYYAIVPHGRHKGLKGWTIKTKTPSNFKLDIAKGVDSKLRARFPKFDFSLSRKSCESIVVGKWYCPFVFVKEGTVKDQVKRSMYYELTLEQRWEQVFASHNSTNDNRVAIDVVLEKEEVFVGGSKAVWNEKSVVDGVIWFTGRGPGRGETRVGLRVEVVERMKWEQERGGWRGGDGRQVKINRLEKFKKNGGWSDFGCYILVERFNLKRMDGSLVMSYDFKHFHQMKTKWE